jgi:phage gpG-like protein
LQSNVSVISNDTAGTVTASSPMPYAQIHNEGGEIIVTQKMKGFFWFKHKEAKENGQKQDAEHWKNLALMKVGKKITIPERRFVGFHPQLLESIKKRSNDIITQDIKTFMDAILKNKK